MARIFMAMNGKRINTLDDLRTNFNGKQMLDFYRAGRLQKWLEELGENDLLETLRDFQEENYDDETLLSMLMAAFELDEKTIAAITETVKAATKANSETEENSVEPEEPEIQEQSSIYTETELKFIELKNRVYATIKKAVNNAVCLTAEQRSVEPLWRKSFDELYGKNSFEIGVEKYFTTDGFKKQNADQEDCLKIPPTFARRDFSTPLGVLEAVLLCEFKECVEDHYSEPAKLHVRYMELLDK